MKTEKVHLKKAKKFSLSSQRWLKRQLNDPYVKEAKEKGYRSRAAFKLIQLNDKFHFLHKGANVVDLGAAPGGWLQVAKAISQTGMIIGVDLTPIDPPTGTLFIQGDFLDDAIFDQLKEAVPQGVDVVLSDMAAPATGHPQTDHLRIMALAEAAYVFAKETLKPGGTFAAKVLRGGTEKELLADLKQHFHKVVHFKPPASRQDSAEMYVVALGFKP